MNDQNRQIRSVTELTTQMKQQLESKFMSVWVTGEVSNLSRPHSGHCYFTLKDENSQIRAVIWRTTAERLRFEIEEGQQIICCGDIDLYLPRGSYQLIARKVEPVGEGGLQLAFKKLHAKLKAEGLFDAMHKKPLPRIPERIAIITSPTGAAVRDFCQVVKRRWPRLKMLVIPCRVQGDEAPGDIVRAIKIASKLKPTFDAMVVTRGGGSIEDLWCFNDERVIRAIHACPIPTLTAIGHEIDVTLSDLVADVRALTPSEAGEKLVPDRSEWLSALSEAQMRMTMLLRNKAVAARSRLDNIESQRCFRRPMDLIERLRERLDRFDSKLNRSIERDLDSRGYLVSELAVRLNSVNPLTVLARGYTLTTDAGKRPIKDLKKLKLGTEIHTRFDSGTVKSQVIAFENSGIESNEDRDSPSI